MALALWDNYCQSNRAKTRHLFLKTPRKTILFSARMLDLKGHWNHSMATILGTKRAVSVPVKMLPQPLQKVVLTMVREILLGQ